MLNYYNLAKQGSLVVAGHPGLLELKSLCQESARVLDVGCGEGTRLHLFLSPHHHGWGVDSNSQAISRAKKQYPEHKFYLADAQALPFKANSFDLVYSCYALEHCQNPEKFLSEMIRVVTPHGKLVIICPNFGAPNRRSPVSLSHPIAKLIHGFVHDFDHSTALGWKTVTPRAVYDESDADTTIEPYLGTLIKYLPSLSCRVVKFSSLWTLEAKSYNPRKLLFKFLGQLGLPPFIYWGPQIFILASKNL